MLERLCLNYPNASPDEIGEKFEKMAGRTVSVSTVVNYQAAAKEAKEAKRK